MITKLNIGDNIMNTFEFIIYRIIFFFKMRKVNTKTKLPVKGLNIQLLPDMDVTYKGLDDKFIQNMTNILESTSDKFQIGGEINVEKEGDIPLEEFELLKVQLGL